MKTYFTHIRQYSGVCILIVVIFIAAMWIPYRAVNRYAISADANGDIYVLDTRTGHTWLRRRYAVIDLGTINKPKYEYVKTKEDIFDQISQ